MNDRLRRTAVLLSPLAGLMFCASPALSSPRDDVRAAALVTYVHGMTPEIARSEFGPAAVPFLLELLEDPDFRRRDNVVAVLGYLGGAESTEALLDVLEDPPGGTTDPDEDRALLLAPQSLGQIASRGEPRALQALMAMTGSGNQGGVLGATAARSAHPSSLRDDLVQMALRGLAYSGTTAARGRLDAISGGSLVPVAGGRDQSRSARDARDLFDRLHDVAPGPGGQTPDHPPADGNRGSSAQPTSAELGSGEVGGALDGTHFNVNNSRLDYANHVNVTSPMTDARLDDCLADASLRFGKSNFAADLSCCAGLERISSGQLFGNANDGRDLIDNSTELNSVLNDSVARFKVVRAINYCGGSGTNIIGCAWIGGWGAAVVRYGGVGTEGTLWAHEYGHNVGLGHNSSGSSYIMYGSLGSGNTGLTQAECDKFHTPSGGASALLADVGTCADGDLDDVHDVVDNCPGYPNNDQLDSNADGVGDACENGCGNGVVDSGEQCDGSSLAGQSCADLGYDDGSLSCASDCSFDDTTCTTCGNGVVEGDEACDAADLGGATCADLNCTAGIASCTASCTLDFTECGECPVCDNDGVCEAQEDCDDCPGDCFADAGAFCGNGVCEATVGEDCITCAADCRGKQGGKPSTRYCCGAGGGVGAVPCSDSRCSTGGDWICSDLPATPSCCGDLTCDGIESGFNCEIDCGPPPFCGDGSCDTAEDSCSCEIDCGLPPLSESSCANGTDDDCDGFSDCSDTDCASGAECSCVPVSGSCSTDSDCCSSKCRGRSGAKSCK